MGGPHDRTAPTPPTAPTRPSHYRVVRQLWSLQETTCCFSGHDWSRIGKQKILTIFWWYLVKYCFDCWVLLSIAMYWLCRTAAVLRWGARLCSGSTSMRKYLWIAYHLWWKSRAESRGRDIIQLSRLMQFCPNREFSVLLINWREVLVVSH